LLQITDYFMSNSERPEEFAIGLHENLDQVEGHDIGQFPGLDFQKPQVAQMTLEFMMNLTYRCSSLYMTN
jgi:hypothetical protein